MKRIILIAVLIVALTAGVAQAGMVKFSYQTRSSGEVKLRAIQFKPAGKGPFGAVVLLHGCAGVYPWHEAWARQIKQWGYVVFLVDSLSPRGIKTTCDNFMKVSPATRAQDAWGALAYLAKQPYVDPKRIALVGFSHGGVSTLVALQPAAAVGKNRFSAAVAFFPYCALPMNQLTAPLLILIGGKDQICPATMCQQKMPTAKNKHEVKLKIYPGAYHGFSLQGVDMTFDGKRIVYDHKAAVDSIARTKEFLAKYLH